MAAIGADSETGKFKRPPTDITPGVADPPKDEDPFGDTVETEPKKDPNSEKKPDCCCILEEVTLEHETFPFPGPSGEGRRGSAFSSILTLTIKFSWRESDKHSPCIVQWWENSDPDYLGLPEGKWYDLSQMKDINRGPRKPNNARDDVGAKHAKEDEEFLKWEKKDIEWKKKEKEKKGSGGARPKPPSMGRSAGELRDFKSKMQVGCTKDKKTWGNSQTSVDRDYPFFNPPFDDKSEESKRRAGKRTLRGMVRVFSGCEAPPGGDQSSTSGGKTDAPMRAEFPWAQVTGPAYGNSVDTTGLFGGNKNPPMNPDYPDLKKKQKDVIGPGSPATTGQQRQKIGWPSKSKGK